MTPTELSIPLKLYREGEANFYSTDLDYLERLGISYTRAPVFYNPRMKLNRDVTISLFSTLSLKTAADLMAASGVRAIRLVLEGGAKHVIANDSNYLAAYVMRKNVELNGLFREIKVKCSDARLEAERMSWEGERVDYIDLDPFGSPAPYIDPFLRAVRGGGIIGVTATDTPPLFGIYPDKLHRFYGIWGKKTPFHKEFGIRSLISFITRVAARLDLLATPILSYGREHYIRVFFRIRKSPSLSSHTIKTSLGWVECCNDSWITHKGLEIPERECNGMLMGPIWLEKISDPELIDKMDRSLSDELKVLLDQLSSESNGPPFYYVLDEICSRMKVRTPKINEVIIKLRERGFFSSRTHLEPLGVKTNAPIKEVEEIIEELS